jgi:hypothetical protein
LKVLHGIVGRGSDGEAGGQMVLRGPQLSVDVLQRQQVLLGRSAKDDIRHAYFLLGSVKGRFATHSSAPRRPSLGTSDQAVIDQID